MFDFLFGKNKDQYASEYDTAIKNAKQERADAAYNYRYNKALYDTNKDYFDKIGVKDPSASYWNDNGQRTNDFTETMNQYGKYLNDLNKEKEDVAWKNRYNIFGDGAIGNLLNPFHQAGTAIQDFVSSGTKEWDNGNRDVLSDLGAIGESALTAAPLAGGLLKTGGGVAKAGAKTLGKTIAKGAGAGAAYGALGGLTDMGSRNFDLGSLLGRTAIGGTVGGGMAGLGYGLGKVWNKYSPATETKTETVTTMGDTTPYQEALKNLKNNATATRYSDVPTNLPTTKGPDLARVTLDNLDDKTLRSIYRSASANTHPDKVGAEVGDKLSKSVNVSNDLLQDFLENGIPTTTTTSTTDIPIGNLQRIKTFASNIPNMGKDLANTKVGTNIANLLKTKMGKVLLGGSAGLTLAGLMKNRNDNNTGKLSDEEMQELYNYVYGGQ